MMPTPNLPCPVCRAALPGNWTEYPDYPFCSARCKTIDLGRWVSEEYRVGSPADEDDEDRSTAPPSDE